MKRGRFPDRHPAGTDIALRGTGALLLAIAVLATRSLLAREHGDAAALSDAMTYLLATIAFVSASMGCGLAHLGAHIFDQIPVSRLWVNIADAGFIHVPPPVQRSGPAPSDQSIDRRLPSAFRRPERRHASR